MPRIAAAIIGCWVLAQCPSMLRKKWTVQRCQGQPKTWAIAALTPSWQSDTHSRTPAKPRARRERRNSRQNASVFGFADVEADDLAAAGLVHGVGDHQALLAHPAALADALDLAVQPDVRVAALERALAKALHL